MVLSNIHNVFFVGIGGIGMSAIARYFHAHGKAVAGYDRTATDLTKTLESLGIDVHYDDDMSLVSSRFLDKAHTIVVYTPAIPASHAELMYFQQEGFEIYKRSQVLGLLTRDTFCLAVAGTHGKTTTTSILGHLLHEAQIGATSFLGGISENYNSNLILNKGEVTVVEADEYDRSFLQLSPDIAGITAMDADHLDIYGEKEALEESFKAFAGKLKEGGKLIVRKGLPLEGITYGVEDGADYQAQNVRIVSGAYHFDLKTPTGVVEDLAFGLPGRHNLSNCVLALAMAIAHHVSPEVLKEALKTYRGVQRRFSYKIKTEGLVYIDDYAHHPEEINAVYHAVRELYEGQRVMVIFQPHLFSRTQDFVEEFAQSLAQFDEVLLLDIYPARELPIEGVTSSWLLNKIENDHKALVRKEELITQVRHKEFDVLLTLGAGDIGEEVDKIKQTLISEN